jgi:hypothetical protein
MTWRATYAVPYLKVHFAQTMNEFHHLLIMESMGGDKMWKDRFIAQHMAVRPGMPMFSRRHRVQAYLAVNYFRATWTRLTFKPSLQPSLRFRNRRV